ncbi:MAG: aminomethyltransferase family protein [Woeseiaceae bacterium]|nr:aminomethyltransferase family protein [Woeseiaceae bacterium]
MTTMTSDPYAGERLKETHFYEREAELNIRDAWSSWNGYLFADYYYDTEYEYFCIRNQCGTYDICPMQKYEITGRDAETMLDRMVTRDVTRIGLNRVAYTVWCTDQGRIIDDGTIFRLADDRFMLTCGSPCTAWLRKAAFGFRDVTITDLSDDLAALSLQGPTSCAVLKRMGLGGVETMKAFDIRHFPFHDGNLMVSRTGFTGDLGYELWIAPELALTMWDELYAAGEDYGIQPYGEAATNMARLEAGFIMPHMDFTEALKTVHLEHDQTPFELQLGWLVDFKKPHFSGRDALLEHKRRGPVWTLAKLDVEGNWPAEDAIMYNNEKCSHEIGYVTSAMWSPTVKANIALAMIRTESLKGELWAEIYKAKELRQYRRMAKCTLKKKPFWMPERARTTPPADV